MSLATSTETTDTVFSTWRSQLSIVLGLACLGFAVAFAVRTAGIAIDDFYITYRYAWHLAHGDGMVFNLGEHVFGLSNPGLAIVLAGLHWMSGAPIEILATIVFAVGLVGIIACLLRTAPDRGAWPEILLGGVLLLSSAFVWKSQGSETSLALCLLLASAAFAERRPILAGLLGGAAVWVRPDTGLGLAVLGVLLIQAQKKLPWRWAVTAALVVLGGALAAYGTFGTVLPITIESKRYLGEVTGGAGFGARGYWVFGWARWLQLSGVWGGVILVYGALGLGQVFRRWGLCGRLLAGYGAVNILVYPMLGVPFSVWYAFPFAAAILFAFAASSFAAWRSARAASSGQRRALTAFSGLVALVAAAALAGSLAWNLGWLREFAELPRQRAYREAALWIRQNTAPDESISFGEIGVLGYYSDRTVEDLLGLVTPRSLPFIAKKDLVGAFLAHPTPIILCHTGRRSTRSILQQPWFSRAYRQVASFPANGSGGVVLVFRREPGRPIPPPRPPRG